MPLGYAYVATHVARPPVEDIDLGTADVEDVELHTSDDLTLQGSYVPSKNGAAVIVAFGRKGSQDKARMLARHGYGVLIFDRRGEGESDGDPNPYAWDGGEKDIVAAVDFLEARPDVDPERIGGVGLSVGGETFLQAAARHDEIKAVVSEGATARSGSELASIEGGQPGPTWFNHVVTAGTAVFSNASPPEHLIDQVDEIAPRAMFLISAPSADPDEERFNRAYYRAAGGPKAALGGPRRRPRGRSGSASARVRAARDALPRPRAARLERRGAARQRARAPGRRSGRSTRWRARCRPGRRCRGRARARRAGRRRSRAAGRRAFLERRERGR